MLLRHNPFVNLAAFPRVVITLRAGQISSVFLRGVSAIMAEYILPFYSHLHGRYGKSPVNYNLPPETRVGM